MCITKLVINLETLVSIHFVNFFFTFTLAHTVYVLIYEGLSKVRMSSLQTFYIGFFLTFEIFVIVHYELHLKKFNFTNDF